MRTILITLLEDNRFIVDHQLDPDLVTAVLQVAAETPETVNIGEYAFAAQSWSGDHAEA